MMKTQSIARVALRTSVANLLGNTARKSIGTHLVRRMSSIGGSNPMFPQSPDPLLKNDLDIEAGKKKKAKDDSFLGMHGGKIAMLAFGAAIVMLYRYFKSGSLRTALEEKLQDEASIEPYEINELREANMLPLKNFAEIVSLCDMTFPDGKASYMDFVKVVSSYLLKIQEEEMKSHANILKGRQKEPDLPTFEASSEYTGARKGYKFQIGEQGLGYYFDKIQQANDTGSPKVYELRKGHLLDRVVMGTVALNDIKQSHDIDREGLPNPSVNDVLFHQLPVDLLLIALSQVVGATVETRIKSLTELTMRKDPTQDQEASVSIERAAEVVEFLLLTWQIPADRRPVEKEDEKYPAQNWRPRTPDEMVARFLRNEKFPDGTQRLTRADFERMLTSDAVCVWAECYRKK